MGIDRCAEKIFMLRYDLVTMETYCEYTYIEIIFNMIK